MIDVFESFGITNREKKEALLRVVNGYRIAGIPATLVGLLDFITRPLRGRPARGAMEGSIHERKKRDHHF